MKNQIFLVMLTLTFFSSVLSAAVYKDDFESYTVGDDIIVVAGETYKTMSDSGVVAQDATDTVNSTQVVSHTYDSSFTSSITRIIAGVCGPFETSAVMQIDLKIVDGQHTVYIGQDDTLAEYVYVMFKEGGGIYVNGSSGQWLSSTYQTGKWYRITFTATIDNIDGDGTVCDIEIFNLTDNLAFETVSNVDFKGSPLFISSGQVHSKTTSGLTNWEGRFDNWSLKPVLDDCQDVLDNNLGYPMDLNSDCYVNFEDLSVLAQQWLWCNDPADSNCTPTWQ